MVVHKLIGRPALFVVLPLLVLPLIHASPPTSPAVTPVCDPITSNTVWTLTASPYVVTCDLIVNAGVTLTIEPGVVVKFQTQYQDLIVDGRLLAQGTAGSPIVFTSYKDDAHGGDTDGDGGATTPAPNDWGGVALRASSSGSVLDHTWIGYGGYGSYANLHLYTSDATVQNNTITWSSQYGLHVGGVDPAHPLLLTNNTFLNNTQWAVYDDTTGARADITLSGNTSSGSLYNGYGLKGAIAGTVTFSSPSAFPFVIWDSWTNLTVDAGSTLTFSPGTVVKFTFGRMLIVNGRLVAQGTAASPIVFTSIKDDAHGGDANGNGPSTGVPGDWGGLKVADTGSGSVLEHTWIGYGGYGGTYADVQLFTSDVTVRDNTLASSAVRGLYVAGVDPAHPLVLTNNTFLNNTQWAAYDDTTGARADITLVGNSSSGSANNGYGLKGSVAGAVTFSSPPSFPFIIWDSWTNLTVDAGSTLTFSPGTVVKFQSNRMLIVNGWLVAQGTEAAPIVFTSWRDDVHGGDTNGDGSATNPAPNDWGPLSVTGDAVFGRSSLLYGGYAGGSALRVQSGGDVDFAEGVVQDSGSQGVTVAGTGRLLLSGSRIERSQLSALVVDGDQAWVHVTGSTLVSNGQVGNPAGGVRNNGKAAVVLGGEPGAGNTIMANAGYGAYQAGTGATMLATYNWWGDASGPYHPTLNPGGLGEEVSDRVAFTPWLSAPDALPAGELVELLAPLSYSPGETLNLGVRFNNVRTETLQNTVVVVRLPELSRYVLSTGGGIYRPGDHDVVWRLGNVVPGGGLNAMVRVETAWGLPPHTWSGAKALVAATNLPNPAVDLAAVLSYTPMTAASQEFLTPAQIEAELAADAELNALFQQAKALGFTFYNSALRETYNPGGELLTLVLLDRARMDETVYVRRDVDRHTILRMTPAYTTEYNNTGGWRHDEATGERSFWGDLAEGGVVANEPLAACPSKTSKRCYRNCLLYSGWGGIINWFASTKQGVECQLCRQVGDCAGCTKLLLSKYPDWKYQLKGCWSLCKDIPDVYDCYEDKSFCYWGWTPVGERWRIHREVCDTTTCDYELAPAEVDTFCHDDQYCEDGCCRDYHYGFWAGSESCATCDGTGDEALSASCTGQAASTCTCATGLCSIHPLENRTAQDPNAKLGPAEAAAGQWISYTVQYENVGAGTAYGVYVEDQLSSLLDASTLQIQDGGLYFPSSRTLFWPVGDLAAGAGGSLHFSVQVPTDVVSGTVLMNGATVTFPSVPETTPTGDVVTLVQDIVARSQRVETTEGTPLAITLSGHSPLGPLTYQIVSEPGRGVLSGAPPNVTYTPGPNFEGLDRFTFQVSDGVKTSAPAEVSIVVNTGAETVPPQVYATSPSHNETGVRVSDAPVVSGVYEPSIYVYFTEPINPTTVTTQSLFLADAAGRHLAGATTYDAGAYAARFAPTEKLNKGATYTATVTTAVRDTSGNALAADTTWSFTTEAGATGGKIYLPMVLR